MGGPAGAAGGGSARNVVQVIDPKRANNGGIILARLRMSYDDLAQAVDRMCVYCLFPVWQSDLPYFSFLSI